MYSLRFLPRQFVQEERKKQEEMERRRAEVEEKRQVNPEKRSSVMAKNMMEFSK